MQRERERLCVCDARERERNLETESSSRKRERRDSNNPTDGIPISCVAAVPFSLIHHPDLFLLFLYI